jgi:hypothetical protein
MKFKTQNRRSFKRCFYGVWCIEFEKYSSHFQRPTVLSFENYDGSIKHLIGVTYKNKTDKTILTIIEKVSGREILDLKFDKGLLTYDYV